MGLENSAHPASHSTTTEGRESQRGEVAAAMEGLQRSSVSFRRQGSSGLVWEDRFISGELTQPKKKEDDDQVEFRELRPSQSVGPVVTMERSRSGGGRTWRTGKVSPAIDPPSPKVSGCGFCGAFGKPAQGQKKQKQRRKR